MLKAGIFLDMENLNRCGGYAIQYRQIKALAEAQGAVVLRANAYMAINHEREGLDLEYRQKKEDYRNRVRREGFHLVLKEVQHYRDVEGQVVTKADADLELAVDALLQSENLDYVMLGTGDGDFLRLVRALQNRGKRVDLLSFMNTSTKLRQEVDNHFLGYMVPNLLPEDRSAPERLRGIMHAVNEEKGYAFLTVQTGMGLDSIREDVFLHITDLRTAEGGPVNNTIFGQYKNRGTIVEFEMEEEGIGRNKAINAVEFRPEFWGQ
ncbi:MAG: NYN domain-containing protein [Candidatus Latescibacteria bacterium]|nr:NYN domain-containing protein [Candidatus Latescibacterota bacterium]